jgi:hypothetical protein
VVGLVIFGGFSHQHHKPKIRTKVPVSLVPGLVASDRLVEGAGLALEADTVEAILGEAVGQFYFVVALDVPAPVLDLLH